MARAIVTTLNVLFKVVLDSATGKTRTIVGEDFIRDVLNSGNLIDQANQFWADVTPRSLAAATSEELDLSGLLTNEQGEVIDFTKVKGLLIVNHSSEATGILRVGGAASNPWIGWTSVSGSKFDVGPGGIELKWNPSLAGFPVVAGTGDKLKVENLHATLAVTYTIIFVGVE